MTKNNLEQDGFFISNYICLAAISFQTPVFQLLENAGIKSLTKLSKQ